MATFKQGDRVKFSSETNQEWIGTVMSDEKDGIVLIGSDIGIYVRTDSDVTKVPQSMKHQLIPHDPLAELKEMARQFGVDLDLPDDKSKKRP